jgi:hypothetical protein
MHRRTTKVIDDDDFTETVELTIDMGGYRDLSIMTVLGTRTGTATYTAKVYVGNSFGDFVLYDTQTTLNTSSATQFKTYTDFPTSTAKVELAFGGADKFDHVKTEIVRVKR